MRYMMLIYSQENDAVTREEMRPVAAAHFALMEEAQQRGVFCAADPLQSSATATTIRKQNGAAVVTDGPFAETKEQLAGYYILDCKNLDEALEWAARIPTACAGGVGCVEVRPLREYSPEVLIHG